MNSYYVDINKFGEQTNEQFSEISELTDEDRARMLWTFCAHLQAKGWPNVRLMPLGDDKRPIIEGNCKLDTDEAREYLHTPQEAADAIRAGTYPGFFIYADREDHGTEGLVILDRDDPEKWPDTPPTFRIISGSEGEAGHLYYRNDGTVSNAKGKGELSGAGSVRASNWGVAAPGSAHSSGGVYHVANRRPVATLSEADLPEVLRPGSTTDSTGREYPAPDDPVDPRDCYELTNDVGVTLRAVKQFSGRLDRLLTQRHPEGYDSASEADMHAVALLTHYRFEADDVATILRGCRARPKLYARDDYLDRTIGRCDTDPLPRGLCHSLLHTPGDPAVALTHVAEVVRATEYLPDEFGVADVVDSGRVDWGGACRKSAMKRTRRALKLLWPWYLDLRQNGEPWLPGSENRAPLVATRTGDWPEVATWAKGYLNES